MKPGCDRVDAHPKGCGDGGQGVDQPDDAGLRRGVVGLPVVTGDPGDGGDPDHGAAAADDALGEQVLGDRERGGEVDPQHRVPPVGAHVGQPPIAGDTSVVHDHVDPVVAIAQVPGDPVRRIRRGDVDNQCVPADLGRHGLQW